jgi:spoIIIJ-associated protein
MSNNHSTRNSNPTNTQRSVVEEAKSIEEATAKAIEKLDATVDSVNIEVLEEQGFLGGLFGKKAKVRVSRKGSLGEYAVDVTRKLLELMGLETAVDLGESQDGYVVDIKSEADGLLIGRRGETLAALQHIVWRILGKSTAGTGEPVERVIIDVSGYRKRRERQVKEMAIRWAKRVESSGERFTSESMSAAERRIVHLALRERNSVRTFSVGRGQERKVVVAPADEVNHARRRS